MTLPRSLTHSSQQVDSKPSHKRKTFQSTSEEEEEEDEQHQKHQAVIHSLLCDETQNYSSPLQGHFTSRHANTLLGGRGRGDRERERVRDKTA